MFSSVAYWSLVALAAIPAAQGLNITALFGPHLSSEAQIFLPTDSDYLVDVTQRWTLHDAPSYLGAIKPATEADVEQIVSKETASSFHGQVS